MWLRKRIPASTRTLWRAGLALGTGLVLMSCGASYVEQSEASVLLLISEINGGAQLDSDVRQGEFSTFICENEVDVGVTVVTKNPLDPGAPSSTVLVDSYQVRYTRTDGRNAEGVDVPYRITGKLAVAVGVGDEVTFPLEVVRRQAKLDPPLTNINQTTVLTVLAEVTLYGKTVSDKRVTAAASFQIDFADFGDMDDACPTN